MGGCGHGGFRGSSTPPHAGVPENRAQAPPALLPVVYFMVPLFMPGLWATRISNQTRGSIISGIIFGLAFTFVPLLIAWQARYKKVPWP